MNIFSAGFGKAIGKRRTPEVRLALGDAYRRVFKGTADQNQAEMVLADLLNFSGCYKVAPVGATGLEYARHAGRQEIAGRILSQLRQTEDEINALERAVRHEALIDQGEGEL